LRIRTSVSKFWATALPFRMLQSSFGNGVGTSCVALGVGLIGSRI
jgi:hypothetical protein